MDPLVKSMLGSFARWLCTALATWLVSRGVLASGDAAGLIAGGSALLLTLAWALWTRYRSRIKFLTALESPVGTSEADVHTKVAQGLGASLTP